MYIVREIVGKRKNLEGLNKKILWEGYSDDDFTWEPLKNLENVEYLIKEYEEKQNIIEKNINNVKEEVKKNQEEK
jgi:hypothetical protein